MHHLGDAIDDWEFRRLIAERPKRSRIVTLLECWGYALHGFEDETIVPDRDSGRSMSRACIAGARTIRRDGTTSTRWR